MRRVALIPARGGSKRLPRKNIMKFLGKPMIAYTIDAAQTSGLFDRVVVSTEDEEIAEVSRKYGAEVELRATELATDTVMIKDVCADFLKREEDRGRCWDILCVLYATAPLRNDKDVEQVVSLIEPGKCNFAIAVTKYDLPPHQALIVGDDYVVEPFLPDLVAARADTVPDLCVDNGSTYAVSVPAFKQYLSFYGPNMRAYHMPRNRSVDIDTQEDFDLVTYYAGCL